MIHCHFIGAKITYYCVYAITVYYLTHLYRQSIDQLIRLTRTYLDHIQSPYTRGKHLETGIPFAVEQRRIAFSALK